MVRVTEAVSARPVTIGDRLEILDVLRGAAVYGILLYNIAALSGYGFTPKSQTAHLPGARFDASLEFLVEFLIQAKFYSLFSFLFGVGFAVFIQRARLRGADALGLFKRRLVGLGL